jgi:hypothetical protein
LSAIVLINRQTLGGSIMIKHIKLILSLIFLLFATAVSADQSKDFGDFTIHYSAFTTDVLTPDVARAYGITRSKNRALLNISVLKKVMDASIKPVKASVDASATNLSAQLKSLEVRELNDQGAIYYIAETQVNHRETLKFNLSITPLGEQNTYRFSFDQQFFTD